MRIAINLATRPFTDLGPIIKRLRIGMAVLAALSLIFGIGLHLFSSQAAEARARERVLDGKIAAIRSERMAAEATMRQPANAQLLQQAEFLNQRFDDKAFSWTLAMEAMETVLPAGVQVTSIEPVRSKEGLTTVHLRVLGPRDRAEELVRNLERSRRFLSPRIVGETAESANSGSQRQEPVSASNRFDFDLLADYNPPTPEELAAEIARLKAAAAKEKAAATPARLQAVPPAAPARPRQLPLIPQQVRPAAVAPQPMNRPPNAGLQQMQQMPRATEPHFPQMPPQAAPNQQPGGPR
jgi:type IV pilus assembly protein PilN